MVTKYNLFDRELGLLDEVPEDLAFDLHEGLVENPNFPEGERFLAEEAPELMDKFRNVQRSDPFDPSSVLLGVDSRYTGQEFRAVMYFLSENEFIERDVYDRVDPTTYNSIKDHSKIQNTLKSFRFDYRRREGLQRLEDEDIIYYTDDIKEEMLRDVALLSEPVLLGIERASKHENVEAFETAYLEVEDSIASNYMGNKLERYHIRNTMTFLQDLGMVNKNGRDYRVIADYSDSVEVLNRIKSDHRDLLTPTEKEKDIQSKMDNFSSPRARDREDYNTANRDQTSRYRPR